MPEETKDETPAEDNSVEKTTEKVEESAEDKLSEEELEAQAEAELKAEAEELEQLREERTNSSEKNQKLQSQVDKIRNGAEEKKKQLESQLTSTEDPAEKLEIERAVFELEKGLFELDRETSAGTNLSEKVAATLKELGYAEDSNVAKKLFALVDKGGDDIEDVIDAQLDLLKSVGSVKTEEKTTDSKKLVDINEGREKGSRPSGDNIPSINASDFGKGGKTRENAVKNLEGFLEELAKKET